MEASKFGTQQSANNGQLPLVEELLPVPRVEGVLSALADQPAVLLLESCLKREHVGRYSFLMADSFAFYTLQRPVFGEDPFSELKAACEKFQATPVEGLPPFQGGAAGLAAYGLGRAWEKYPDSPHDEFQLPAMAVGLYDWVITWDHLQNRAWIISHGFPETDPSRRTQRAKDRLQGVRKLIDRSPSNSSRGNAKPLDNPAPQYSAPGLTGLTSDFSKDGYLIAVEKVIEYIHAGDIFQANLSQRLLMPSQRTPLELFTRLRDANAAPFAGYFACDDWAIASASPERFLRVDSGEVETRPIKGTRQRAKGPEADLYRRDELRESEKDQSENVMIVDLMRNDLSRVCQPGSIRVPELYAVETYETVQHLVSEIRGKLTVDHDAWDMLAAGFPGGSITGAPKVRAMEIIAELEPTARGPYCGSLFYIGFDGNMDSSILIRTFICKDGWVQCSVGGGIVAQSDPVAEYEETLHKAEGMLRAL